MVFSAYYKPLSEKTAKCLLCPNLCTIPENETGFCNARHNKDGKIIPRFPDQYSAIALDPLEKKPFFHLNPGQQVLSLGSLGCNFRCIHCQNWEISQPHRIKISRPLYTMTPEQIIDMAKQNTPFIAFTYNEPLINVEAIYETALLARQYNCYVLLVTNGFINRKPLKELAPLISGFSIDLKAFNKKAYYDLTGIDAFELVKKNIQMLVKQDTIVELTTNLVTGINDEMEQLRQAADWIHSLNPYIPWHITTFRPLFDAKDRPFVSMDFVKKAVDLAREKLTYVYSHFSEDTLCPHCKTPVITRRHFSVQTNRIENNCCPSCKKEIPYMTIKKVLA